MFHCGWHSISDVSRTLSTASIIVGEVRSANIAADLLFLLMTPEMSRG